MKTMTFETDFGFERRYFHHIKANREKAERLSEGVGTARTALAPHGLRSDMSKLVFSGDALADASVLGAFLLNAKNARRDTVDGRAERDAGGGGGGGGHLSAESTASSASSSAQTSTKWVSGARRRMVRRPNLPFVPRRRTVEEKAVFRKWLEDEEVVMQTGLHNDCGCALHSRGCFHALIFALIERIFWQRC